MRVLVTGGSGFLGHYVCAELADRGHDVQRPSHKQLDLMYDVAVGQYLRRTTPDAVVHLAALCGGIGANRKRPAEFFYANLTMGVELMHQAFLAGVGKFVALGTVCSYPKHCPTPFRERDLWNGYPEQTNAPYGLAKKALLVQAQAYRAQYGFNAVYLLPVNMYGPGDNFDLESSHVIPAIIRRVERAMELKKPIVLLWGSGEPTREFLYVEDAAKGICDALEKHDGPEPINLGTGQDISICALAQEIADIMEYKGIFLWDTSKPDGQPARRLDVSRAWKLLGWEPKVGLREGLERTIEWWKAHARDDES